VLGPHCRLESAKPPHGCSGSASLIHAQSGTSDRRLSCRACHRFEWWCVPDVSRPRTCNPGSDSGTGAVTLRPCARRVPCHHETREPTIATKSSVGRTCRLGLRCGRPCVAGPASQLGRRDPARCSAGRSDGRVLDGEERFGPHRGHAPPGRRSRTLMCIVWRAPDKGVVGPHWQLGKCLERQAGGLDDASPERASDRD
jgi:hypothetical protein